ncbi:MAG: hypothetical protein JWP38_3620 [Herbaspirillum sp.]|jgi:uncharacterized membrane protein YccC|nr:hypothetical protein [Herbaspirillum sp.]
MWNPRALLFSLNCYLAVMLALFVAFSFALPNPWWAALTVFITSRPAIGGGIWAVAAYRLAGTLLGMGAALVIIPNLVDAPELMIVALAAWVGLCTFISLLDRSPRSYAFVLAGYTTTLVALPLVDDPVNLFNTAVYRSEEVLIGVLSAALMHNLIFPRSMEGVMLAKLNATMKDAAGWIAGALHGTPEHAERLARRRLAADISELTVMASNWRFEPLRVRAGSKVSRALEEQLAALLPLLTAVEDRVLALGGIEALEPALKALLGEAGDWVGDGQSVDAGRAESLLQACAALTPRSGPGASEIELLTLNLMLRLGQLIVAWRDCNELAGLLRTPAHRPSARLADVIAAAGHRILHTDPVLALWSGLTAVLTIVCCGAFAMVLQWPPGIIAVGIASLLCTLFAAMDDPTPVQSVFLTWALVAIPIAAVYVFIVLPEADGFAELALALLPLLTAIGYFMLIPKYMLRAFSLALLVMALIGLQPAQRPDFIGFANLSLAAFIGTLIAMLVTKLVRVIHPDVSARRLVRAGWNELARVSSGAHRPRREQFATLMLDRMTMLAPRLAQARSDRWLPLVDTLADLQIGVNLVDLLEAAKALPRDSQPRVQHLQRQLASYFLARSRQLARATAVARPPPLAELDEVVHALLASAPSPQREHGLGGAAGLRRNLATSKFIFQEGDAV